MQSRDHRAIKRQIMSIREIFVASRVPFYPVPYPSHARHQYMPPVVPPSSVYRLQRPKAVSLPQVCVSLYSLRRRRKIIQLNENYFFYPIAQESHSEVGFEMSYEEMMELLDEFYERLPRGAKSRDEVQNEYMPLFEECCKNIDVCRMKKARDCPYI